MYMYIGSIPVTLTVITFLCGLLASGKAILFPENIFNRKNQF